MPEGEDVSVCAGFLGFNRWQILVCSFLPESNRCSKELDREDAILQVIYLIVSRPLSNWAHPDKVHPKE